jgi:hypothetical protein
VRWAVPLAAAATAVALWVNVDRQAREVPAPLPAPQSQQVAVDAVSPAAPPSANPSAAPVEGVPAEKPARLAGADAAKEVTEARRGNREPSPARDEERAAARKQEGALAKAEEKASSTAAASPSVPSAAPAAPAPAATPAVPPPAGANESARFRSDVDKLAAARQLGQVLPVLEVASPDPLVRWRVRGALIDRSVDGGQTWRAPATVPGAEFLAGSSPSPNIAWLAGRRGTVARTTDGDKWQRLEFPETVDLTGIQALSDREATVTTADGRAFRTIDGGRTWSRQEGAEETEIAE